MKLRILLRQIMWFKATDQSLNQEWVFRSKFSVYSFLPWYINKYVIIFLLWDGKVWWAGIKAWNGGRIASHQGTFATSKGARFEQDQGVLLRAQKKQHIFQMYRFLSIKYKTTIQCFKIYSYTNTLFLDESQNLKILQQNQMQTK